MTLRVRLPGLEPSFWGFQGIPTPFPTAGIPPEWKPSFVHGCFVVVLPLGGIPDFGRFMARAAGVICVEAALAKTSLITSRSRDNRVHRRTGYLFLGGLSGFVVIRVCG